MSKTLNLVCIFLLLSILIIPCFADSSITDDFLDTSKVQCTYQLYQNITEGKVYIDDISKNGLVAWWRLNEGEGTNASDSGGKGHHGTITVPTWVVGKQGYALDFDGGRYVEVPDADDLDISEAITLEAWVKPRSQNDWDMIICKAIYPNYGYELGINSESKVFMMIRTDGWYNILSDNPITLDVWHYIVATYDRQYVKIYVDSVLAMTPWPHTLQIQTGTCSLFLSRVPEGAHEFKGISDENRIYNRALTQAEITENYNKDAYRFWSLGTIYSKNLVKEQDVKFESFYYKCSILGTQTLKIQFSTNNSTWYNALGSQNEWTILINGEYTLSLSLSWSTNFYYRINFTRGDNDSSPNLDKITLYYSSIVIIVQEQHLYIVILLLAFCIFLGFLGLKIHPIFGIMAFCFGLFCISFLINNNVIISSFITSDNSIVHYKISFYPSFLLLFLFVEIANLIIIILKAVD